VCSCSSNASKRTSSPVAFLNQLSTPPNHVSESIRHFLISQHIDQAFQRILFRFSSARHPHPSPAPGYLTRTTPHLSPNTAPSARQNQNNIAQPIVLAARHLRPTRKSSHTAAGTSQNNCTCTSTLFPEQVKWSKHFRGTSQRFRQQSWLDREECAGSVGRLDWGWGIGWTG
jgi:hypothetical protein